MIAGNRHIKLFLRYLEYVGAISCFSFMLVILSTAIDSGGNFCVSMTHFNEFPIEAGLIFYGLVYVTVQLLLLLIKDLNIGGICSIPKHNKIKK